MRTAISVETPPGRAVVFGPFTFDRTSRLLWKGGVEVPLPPRVLGVLALLVERPGELVTKHELIATVWRDAFVTETSLSEAVSVLRQTIGDDPQHPTYIQTLHRRGYRFIAGVQAMPRAVVDDVVSPPSTAAVEFTPRLALLVPWTIALFALLTAASAVWQYLDRAAPQPRQPVRFALSLPPGLAVAHTGGPVAVSNDGSLIALAACSGSDCGIYLRPLSQTDFTLVAGTAGGAAPFFSPDGRSIGYFANGRLQTIVLSGGSPVAIADAAEAAGATWLDGGEIVFARTAAEGLFVADSRGGPVRALTTPGSGEGGHHWPAATPDGSVVVFTVDAARDYAGALSMRTGRWSRLLDEVDAVRVPVTGYLLAQRGTNLLASAIDERALSISGLPVPVATLDTAPPAHFAMSAAGTLVIAPPGSTALHVTLDWADEMRRRVPAPQPALPR